MTIFIIILIYIVFFCTIYQSLFKRIYKLEIIYSHTENVHHLNKGFLTGGLVHSPLRVCR